MISAMRAHQVLFRVLITVRGIFIIIFLRVASILQVVRLGPRLGLDADRQHALVNRMTRLLILLVLIALSHLFDLDLWQIPRL